MAGVRGGERVGAQGATSSPGPGISTLIACAARRPAPAARDAAFLLGVSAAPEVVLLKHSLRSMVIWEDASSICSRRRLLSFLS